MARHDKSRAGSAHRLSRQRLNEFLTEWNIGVAIFDAELHYQAVNPWLAARDGLTVEQHNGKQITEVLGEGAMSLETALKAALISGQPITHFETEASLPLKREGKRWIANFFPTKDVEGHVTQIAAIFLESEDTGLENVRGTRISPNEELLRSWKDIANYMGTCVKTVQRWERQHDLPVRRVTRSRGAMVFALKSEMDAWTRSHPVRRADVHHLFQNRQPPSMVSGNIIEP